MLTHSTFWLAQLSLSAVHAIVCAVLFHRRHLSLCLRDGACPPPEVLSDAVTLEAWEDTPERALLAHYGAAIDARQAVLIEQLVALLTVVFAPLSLMLRRKECLLLIALAAAGGGCWILVTQRQGAIAPAAALLGAAFGASNAYTTTLWVRARRPVHACAVRVFA